MSDIVTNVKLLYMHIISGLLTHYIVIFVAGLFTQYNLSFVAFNVLPIDVGSAVGSPLQPSW